MTTLFCKRNTSFWSRADSRRFTTVTCKTNRKRSVFIHTSVWLFNDKYLRRERFYAIHRARAFLRACVQRPMLYLLGLICDVTKIIMID